jgi:molybdate/tungstate transport system substrate-binding protein
METQRETEGGYSRRAFLRVAGIAGVGGIAGCLGSGGDSATVAILSAGSLQHALENGFESSVDVPVRIEAHGSATVARMVAEGQRDPDVVTVADTALFEAPLSPPWYSEFASNAVVVAYNPDTEGGRRVAEAGADRWYEALLSDGVSLGRTDPDQDPLGYRALFSLELASRYYDDAPALHERVPRREQIYPETGLITRFETGAIDAAIAYRNMAVERGYEYVGLPPEIDLSDPDYVGDWYSTVSYELPEGTVVDGDLIAYASTIRNGSDAALTVFDAHTTGAYLAESGFLLRDRFPHYEGDVPADVRRATAQGTEGRVAERTLADAVSDLTVLI